MSESAVINRTVKLYDLAAGAGRLYRLVFSERRFVPARVTADEETAAFCYDLQELVGASSLEKSPLSDKLRFLLNAADLAPLTAEFSFSLNPENLCADLNLEPKILQRDLRGEDNGMDFTAEYRALAGCLLRPKNTYEQYLGSGEGLYKKHKLLRKLVVCGEPGEIWAVLKQAYDEELHNQQTKKRLVNLKRYRTMQVLTPVFLVLFLASGWLAGYLYLYDLPFRQSLIDAGHAFLLEDYDLAIETLESIAPMTLPKEERYQLARAYIISESLSQEQKQHILSDVTPRTEDNILLYWIELGRLEYAAAIDTAQRIGDDELQLYALVKYEVAVQNDAAISGEEKTQLLSAINGQIEALRKKLEEKEDVTGGTGL